MGLISGDYIKLTATSLHFFEHFEVLAENPFQYPAVNEIRQGYRRSVCGTDSVYYRVTNEETSVVEIMAIIGKQDVNQWL